MEATHPDLNLSFPAPRPDAEQLSFAFGLVILSEIPLPEFAAARNPSSPVDVHISCSAGEAWIDEVRHLPSSWWMDCHEARFWFSGVGGFRVSEGRHIAVSPEPGVENSLLRMYIEGMMIATLLYQRGFFVLHSSVVHLGNFAAAFLGHVGAGKSSTAAALHARGHAVVTDDNAAINLKPEKPEVTPAFPFVKVFPSIAESLGFARDSLTRMHASQPKSVRDVSALFPERPLPLDRIYVLTREPVDGIKRVPSHEAIIELVRNSVPTRWKLAGGADHLRACAALASRVPVYRIRTFDTLPEIPELASRIEQHCGWRT